MYSWIANSMLGSCFSQFSLFQTTYNIKLKKQASKSNHILEYGRNFNEKGT